MQLFCMEFTLNDPNNDVISLIDAEILKQKKDKNSKYMSDLHKLTIDEINTSINALGTSCADCGSIIYSYPKTWQTQKLCYTCHKPRYLSLCEEVNTYLIEKGKITCNFCRKIRINSSEFHLDHINMFDKVASVCDMIMSGENIDLIKIEVDKCQLLCISCHAIVTHFEHQYGFIKAKRSKKPKDIIYLAKVYEEYMGEIYASIRALHGN